MKAIDESLNQGLLTYFLRAQVKKLKMKIKNKFYIENIIFTTFKTLNTQISRKISYIWFFNLCPKDTS